jgi:HEAT repeat protein
LSKLLDGRKASMRKIAILLVFTAALLAAASIQSCAAVSDAQLNDFLSRIKSPDADIRYQAWRSAGPMGAKAVVPLGELLASDNPSIAKAAGEALKVIVHHAGRPNASAERKAVSLALTKLLAKTYPVKVRREAANLLGFIGGSESLPALAKCLQDPDVREDARLAIERIPGSASLKVLKDALKTTPREFHPNLQQSIRHRTTPPSAIGTGKWPETSGGERR